MNDFTLLKNHIIPAYISWMKENEENVHICFFSEHKDIHLSKELPSKYYKELRIQYNDQIFKTKVLTLSLHHENLSFCKYRKEELIITTLVSQIVVDMIIPYECIFKIYCPDNPLLEREFVFELDFLIKNALEANKIRTPLRLVKG